MLLAIDIGNSSIKFGVFEGDNLVSKFSVPTERSIEPRGLWSEIGARLDLPISAAIACSVVPGLESPLRKLLKDKFSVDLQQVENSWDFGLAITYEPLESLGTDRLVAAFAAVENYGKPVIVCDFGTATTIDAVDSKGEFLGGTIAPGMRLLAEALHSRTSKLPHIEIEKPPSIFGNSTIGSIRSGIFWGHTGLVEKIIDKMTAELIEVPRVIATGGFARLMANETAKIDKVDEDLVLEGLKIVSRVQQSQNRER